MPTNEGHSLDPAASAMLKRWLHRADGPPDVMAECFRAFFREKLGRPHRTETIARDRSSPSVDIEVHHAPWDRHVHAIVSVGLCAYGRLRGEPFEIMLLVDRASGDAVQALSRVVQLLADEPSALFVGAVFEGARSLGTIGERWGKTALVLTLPRFEEPSLGHVECGATQGHVFLLLPVTDAERKLLDAEGLTALEDRLDGHDVSDLSRASVA